MARRRYRVSFIGLPLFAKRLARQMGQYDTENSYLHFDTYYSKKDLLRCLIRWPRTDLVYSVNGGLERSGIFKLALRTRKKLVMHWAGTDVVRALKAHKEGRARRDLAEHAVHSTEAPWLQEELRQVGVDARLVRYSAVECPQELPAWSKEFQVLTYFCKGREDFYGWQKVKQLALALPEVEFHIVGTDMKGQEIPKNVNVHGWVDDMTRRVADAAVILRLTEHDGLSNTVLEALGMGRYVLFTYELTGCQQSKGHQADLTWLREMKENHDGGGLTANHQGRDYVMEYHHPEKVWRGLKSFIEEVIRG